MYHLFMRLTDGEKLSLNVNEDWTVAELKQAVIKKAISLSQQNPGPVQPGLGLGEHGAIRVIFAGVELLDSLTVKDCDIPDGSIIHVVVKRPGPLSTDKDPERESDTHSYSSLLTSLSDLEVTSKVHTKTQTIEHSSSKRKPCFYVFCKETCGVVTRGKLRVCCRKCKMGAFTVLQEFYFKCAEHQTKEDDRVPALHLVKTNTKDVPCLACEHVFDPVLVFPCELGHVICLECFKLYCETKLNERQFIQHNQIGYSLPCPAGCENSLIQETHHFRILGNDQYNKYQSFATEECVLQNGGVLCPAPGCGTAIFADEDAQRLECLQHGDIGCGFVFCRTCKLSYHDGDCTNTLTEFAHGSTGYQVDLARVERARWDQASRMTIQNTTKPCPNCNSPVEKSGGCMHMQCPRATCKFEWCWLCCVAWNNDCMALHWFGEDPFFL
ncbi:E3 ubiquitin-protein ligase parkin-like isoform X2 [Anneissia japonica]|uniref:E3 ubiquitin-protein ligase parkin-like isoform X2 n=1 Tax=Anneissia japonica TaxID=1529436 RepID=UPI0014258738|nr:E3 ubiquitin-protein ligase parkin-like isoform X2 [Anneissia japonica]